MFSEHYMAGHSDCHVKLLPLNQAPSHTEQNCLLLRSKFMNSTIIFKHTDQLRFHVQINCVLESWRGKRGKRLSLYEFLFMFISDILEWFLMMCPFLNNGIRTYVINVY